MTDTDLHDLLNRGRVSNAELAATYFRMNRRGRVRHALVDEILDFLEAFKKSDFSGMEQTEIAEHAGMNNLRNTVLQNELIAAAEKCDSRRLEQLIRRGAPINYSDSTTGATALHYAAMYDARPAFRILLKTGKCDFLIRDKLGRLASELAGEYGHDPAMARLLLMLEVRQARAQGVELRRRPAAEVS